MAYSHFSDIGLDRWQKAWFLPAAHREAPAALWRLSFLN
jgi:hypothetical protein